MSNDNMTNSGKSLPYSLTEDSSAQTIPPPYKRQHKYDCSERVKKRFEDTGYLKMRSTREQLNWWDDLKLDYPYHCDCCSDFEADLVYAMRHILRTQLEKEMNQAKFKEKARIELGPREFTLTYSPSWYESDEDAQRAMEVAIEKLTRYYKDEIIEFHAIGEFTRDGRAHVHGWYHLDGGRKITDKNFKRAWKHWNPKRKLGKGFEGGHHQTIQRVSDFSGYTEKHLDEAWLNIHINNGCQEVNVPTLSQEDHSSSSDDTQDSS